MPVSRFTGTYPYTAVPYHKTIGTYSKSVLAAATFYATGSNANPVAFYISGSAGATVTLVNGGQIAFPSISATAPLQIHEMAVYSVDAGTVYLLYKL
jgi:hypothetical protein